MTRVGERIRVRGDEYAVVEVGPASQTPKFWGKRVFTLRKSDTKELFVAFGKSVAANSKLTPKETLCR